jgi:hypothetical protein
MESRISDLGTTRDPKIIEGTRQYIRDSDRIAETTSSRELYYRRVELYPDRVNLGLALWPSAGAAKS